MDWGRTFAVLAHFYGFKPWDVERLTEMQIQMYMENVGYIRFLEQVAQLQYAFGKLQDEDIEKMLSSAATPPDPNSLRARGWRAFVASYNAMDDDAAREDTAPALRLKLSPGAAKALADMVSSGELTRYPNGSVLWRMRIQPIWASLVATANTGVTQ
jgi:hypothetical protein